MFIITNGKYSCLIKELYMLEKRELEKLAIELNFHRDTLEKVLRLIDILKKLNSDSFLKDKLALKGGTAINLTMLDLPRLSVDIDLDYATNNTRDEMIADKEKINVIIKRYMQADNYILSDKSKDTYSLTSFVFNYINAGGMRDNIKIEINYSMRCHALPLENKSINFLEGGNILTVNSAEIFASKITALLSRTAARDLYDINNILTLNFFEDND